MWLIEWHQHQLPWVTLKVTFVDWNLPNSHTSGIIARIDYDVFTHNPNVHVACIFNNLIEIERPLKVAGSYILCEYGILKNGARQRRSTYH